MGGYAQFENDDTPRMLTVEQKQNATRVISSNRTEY
jgi:hypothetical protein